MMSTDNHDEMPALVPLDRPPIIPPAGIVAAAADTPLHGNLRAEPNSAVAETKKKRRSQAELLTQLSAGQARYAAATSKQWLLQSGLSTGDAGTRFRRALLANAAALKFVPSPPSPPAAVSSASTLAPGEAAMRRTAVEFALKAICGSPPESEWDGHGGAVAAICARLDHPPGSAHRVREQLASIAAAEAKDENYNPSAGCQQRGVAKALIKPQSTEAMIVHDAQRGGLSITQTAVFVNEYRTAMESPRLCWSAVQGFIDRDPCIKTHRRQMKKSGKTARPGRSRTRPASGSAKTRWRPGLTTRASSAAGPSLSRGSWNGTERGGKETRRVHVNFEVFTIISFRH
jgi:hypothetical protein